MAEVVGAIASVVTIAQLAIQGVKSAKSFYRAQDELQTLLEQLEDFTRLVAEVESHLTVSNSTLVADCLRRARASIDKLDQIVRRKILVTIKGTALTRRRAWMKNKSKICRLQDALKEHRAGLLVATSANAWYASHSPNVHCENSDRP